MKTGLGFGYQRWVESRDSSIPTVLWEGDRSFLKGQCSLPNPEETEILPSCSERYWAEHCGRVSVSAPEEPDSAGEAVVCFSDSEGRLVKLAQRKVASKAVKHSELGPWSSFSVSLGSAALGTLLNLSKP